MQKAEIGKVSFASDSDLEDNFKDEYKSTTDHLRKKGADAVDTVNTIATPIKLEFNLEHDTVVFHIWSKFISFLHKVKESDPHLQ
eukprot:14086485-Ditylum_brightwellii.AAC.1